VLARDTAMTYADLTDALHVLVRGGAMLALNVDPRVPVEGGRMLPGTGAIAAALSYASGVRARDRRQARDRRSSRPRCGASAPPPIAR
jgi:ribonucleotide monophosphatase NagD (HAD superfamily)